MARLNDVPAPSVESVDALKRRFIRQNREIARVNSNQSQRIRNLECEISRLLAENIALREQAIRANEEAEKSRISSRLGKDVLVLRQRLQARLEEVSSLVEELGELPEKAARRSSIARRRSGIAQNIVKSPDEKEWRSRRTLTDVLGAEQDGRLPAILENKYYPRRTLEAAELRSLGVEEDREEVESPELGPPPVVHFDVNEPIVFDKNKSPKRLSGDILVDNNTVSVPSNNNLDTRRKRRTSSLLHDLPGLDNHDKSEASSDTVDDQQQTLKAAAKRKVDAYELEEHEKRTSTLQDDFVFKTTKSTERPRPSRFTGRPIRQHEEQAPERITSPQKQLTRQALAPKSTNSPTKSRLVRGLTNEKGISNKDDTTDDRRVRSVRSVGSVKAERPLRVSTTSFKQDIDRSTIDQQEQPPKTPGIVLADVVSPSPLPTEPSAKVRSTAISEMAITHSVEDVLNGSIGRGSRRARAAVSYAEPNLRDKMRRPDKKLVGAVEGLAKSAGSELSRSLNSEPAEVSKSRQSTAGSGITKPDEEQADSSATKEIHWADVPTSNDLNNRSNEATSPLQDKDRRSVIERRHKRTLSEAEGRSNSRVQPAKTTDEDISQDIDDRLSIFDPPTSSPAGPKFEDTTKDGLNPNSISSMPLRKAASTSTLSNTSLKTRRHSIQVQQQGSTSSALVMSTTTRPASALSSREPTSLSSTNTSTTKLKRASSIQTLPQSQTLSKSTTNSSSNSNNNNNNVGNTDSSSSIGRTIGTRRRSMMV